jgi:hypothetical protein
MFKVKHIRVCDQVQQYLDETCYLTFCSKLTAWLGNPVGILWNSTVIPVVSCKHGTQDVCTVKEVRKYPSMCKMVESVHAAVETQRRIFR